MTDRVDINRLLTEMRSLKTQTQVFNRPGELSARDIAEAKGLHGDLNVTQKDKVPSFGEMFGQAINKVNDIQQTSSNLAKGFEQGAPGIDITDVMVASQKASVAFQSMVQVRNKLIDAYRDVMNMPL